MITVYPLHVSHPIVQYLFVIHDPSSAAFNYFFDLGLFYYGEEFIEVRTDTWGPIRINVNPQIETSTDVGDFPEFIKTSRAWQFMANLHSALISSHTEENHEIIRWLLNGIQEIPQKHAVKCFRDALYGEHEW